MSAARSSISRVRLRARGVRNGGLTGLSLRLAIAALSLVLASTLWIAGAANGIEDTARKLFFAAQSREASGQLHVVEMDAASLAAIDRWPWQRRHYAAVVEHLSAAGAHSITFDVDFSTPSEPAEDARFAAALARADTAVVLPTFAQKAAQGDNRMLSALPIPQLRENTMLASVAVAPDQDGFVRRMPLGTVTDGVPRPTLSAQIAGRAGTAGQDFPLDLSIDPDSIPRHSFAAVENGRFRPGEFEGKDILIGATAIEMGDRYPVPGYGVLPGVIVQAIAAETLYGSVPLNVGPLWLLVLAIVLLCAIPLAKTKRSAVLRGALMVCALVAVYWIAWASYSMLLEIVPALFAASAATVLALIGLFRSELREKRRHDAQTGLPNRLAMEALKGTEERVTVAAIIGGYEKLHAVLGAQLSSELVGRVSERLSIGNNGQTIYRIDDRMLAWSSDIQGIELEQILAGLSAVMRSPIEIGGRPIDVQIAFGIAEPEALAEAAHSASEALRRGERWQYHIAAENAALEQQVSLMGELDLAIARQEIEVLYQPKLHIDSNRIGSVEALVRWNHPARGYLRPDIFIPLAEESDRICDLTLFVLQRTIRDLSQWCENGLTISAAVNISARLVVSETFLAKAEALLQQSGLLSQRLIFEVTESATITDPAAAIAALHRFRDLGVSISIDDYGTGQSTLTYLKQLPLSELKIDRSFVQFAHRDQNDALLVRSTVNLAHELGLAVVAEGVEEEECLDFLREVGCDYAQGYLIAKPMSAKDIQALVTAKVSLAA